MSDQPGIPAITVFPPFNPAPRRDDPAREATREQTPPAAEQAPEPAADPRPETAWDAAAPPAPMPWDFEAPAPEPEADAAAPAGEMEIGDEDDDLPWLEVPTPRAPDGAADVEIRADDTPNFADWMRTEDQPPPVVEADAGAGEDADADVPPIGDFAMDAQPWAPEVENAADDWAPEQPAEPWKAPDAVENEQPWQAPRDGAADDWRAPASEAPAASPWDAPADVDVPEPELYDLPDVPPPDAPAAARPWTDAEAPLFEP
ncbi:MAG TPA: hypothetical protein VEX86_19370, partial [Longimicrobium sp.]|nr:hypothetical protein [Longimicrobium sp.]